MEHQGSGGENRVESMPVTQSETLIRLYFDCFNTRQLSEAAALFAADAVIAPVSQRRFGTGGRAKERADLGQNGLVFLPRHLEIELVGFCSVLDRAIAEALYTGSGGVSR